MYYQQVPGQYLVVLLCYLSMVVAKLYYSTTKYLVLLYSEYLVLQYQDSRSISSFSYHTWYLVQVSTSTWYEQQQQSATTTPLVVVLVVGEFSQQSPLACSATATWYEVILLKLEVLYLNLLPALLVATVLDYYYQLKYALPGILCLATKFSSWWQFVMLIAEWW